MEPPMKNQPTAIVEAWKKQAEAHDVLWKASCRVPQGTYLALQEWACEFAPEHWISNEDVPMDHDEIVEMLQTSSVTTIIGGRKFELSIVVKEVE